MKNNFEKDTTKQLSKKRKCIFTIFSSLLVLIFLFVICEMLIMSIHPHKYLYPRYKFSPNYGIILYKNCKMIHACPRKWKFTYTINEYQYRGKPIPISNYYDKKNIIILGDSNSFGIGVNDENEYPSVMGKKLKDKFNVINLAVPGWGLTQQIRRYYEFGQLFFPKIVIIQFDGNDPEDNFNNNVVKIENGRFTFQKSNNTINWIKIYLSKSIIQYSQIYNLFRNAAYQFFSKTIIEKTKLNFQKENICDTKIQSEEMYYNNLLELFVQDLNNRGVKFFMISVNGQLEQFTYIKDKVTELDSKGLLNYIEVIPWFENVTNYESPEGHMWGKKAHRIIGTKLSEIIKKEFITEEK